MEPYYTQAEQLYQVHGARGEDPTEPPASAPYPFPPVSHEPRIQRLFDDMAAVGLHPFHSPCGVMLDEARARLQRLHPVRDLRRLPLPGARQVRRRGHRGAARAGARQRDPGPQRPASAGWRPTTRGRSGHGRRRRGRREEQRFSADIVVRVGRCGELGEDAAGQRQRPAPERPGQRLGPGRPQLRVPQQPGVPGRVEGEERHPVPEDPGPQRLLLRRRRLRVPDGQRADGRQVLGADVPGREADRDQAGADVRPAGRRRARRRLLAVGRGPPGPGQPGHAGRRRQHRAAATPRTTRSRWTSSTTGSRSTSATWACTRTT